MAASYAGVVGNNDNSNDIVVRGNTPIGLLWRMDGVNIPNPNHFAAAGNTGGPVTILNNQTLANSDFMTAGKVPGALKAVVLKAMYGIGRVIAARLVAMSAKFGDLEAQADPAGSRELREFRKKLFSDWSL